MANKIVSVTYYQTLKDVFWAPASGKKWIRKYKCQKNWKNLHVLSKKAKIRDVKMLKQLHYH